jgi:hypothetical protein
MNDSTDPLAMVQRLLDATNAHDIDALVSCFSPDYVNETPVHPARGFRGTEQVRRNWTQLFHGIPDLRASVLARATDGGTAWTEWEISGVRRDGEVHIMRGVIVFGVTHGKAAWAKFYLEPVDQSGGDVNDAVAQASGPKPPNKAGQ